MLSRAGKPILEPSRRPSPPIISPTAQAIHAARSTPSMTPGSPSACAKSTMQPAGSHRGYIGSASMTYETHWVTSMRDHRPLTALRIRNASKRRLGCSRQSTQKVTFQSVIEILLSDWVPLARALPNKIRARILRGWLFVGSWVYLSLRIRCVHTSPDDLLKSYSRICSVGTCINLVWSTCFAGPTLSSVAAPKLWILWAKSAKFSYSAKQASGQSSAPKVNWLTVRWPILNNVQNLLGSSISSACASRMISRQFDSMKTAGLWGF